VHQMSFKIAAFATLFVLMFQWQVSSTQLNERAINSNRIAHTNATLAPLQIGLVIQACLNLKTW